VIFGLGKKSQIDAKVKHIIFSTLIVDIYMKILSCKSVKDIWTKIKEICGNKESLAKKNLSTCTQVEVIYYMAKGNSKNSIIKTNSMRHLNNSC